jgi:hypothetical protein
MPAGGNDDQTRRTGVAGHLERPDGNDRVIGGGEHDRGDGNLLEEWAGAGPRVIVVGGSEAAERRGEPLIKFLQPARRGGQGGRKLRWDVLASIHGRPQQTAEEGPVVKLIQTPLHVLGTGDQIDRRGNRHDTGQVCGRLAPHLSQKLEDEIATHRIANYEHRRIRTGFDDV